MSLWTDNKISALAGIQKTNAARLLDNAKIAYELIPYTVDPDNLAADHVAAELGEDINQVYKTLVLRGDKTGHIVCVIPGNCEVDLKKAAKCVGEKSIEMLKQKDLLSLTGYVHGGCSPIGMKKFFTTTIHNSAQNFDTIIFSGGRVGLQLEMPFSSLSKAITLSTADLIL